MNNRKIACSDRDRAFAAIVRDEYELLGLGIPELAGELQEGKCHARSLWAGVVLWTLPEVVSACYTPHFREGTDEGWMSAVNEAYFAPRSIASVEAADKLATIR